MKRMLVMLLILALTFCSTGAAAQEYVSVAELYDQAQALEGWWQATFDSPNGEVTVDAPIIVPDIETIPVITVEPAKPLSQELYDTIAQGTKTSKSQKAIQYETVIEGITQEFFLGHEEEGKSGYDAVNCAWIQRGNYRFSVGSGTAADAEPKTYHYPWELDFDQAYVRGSDQTLNEMMALWQKDIALCYPEESYVIKPKRIYLNGSVLGENEEEGEKYEQDGDCLIYGEQYFFDLPLIGAIGSYDGENLLWPIQISSDEKNKAIENLTAYLTGSCGACYNQNRFLSANNADNRSMTDLNKVRSIEYEDIPLASLDEVLQSVEEKIEEGSVEAVYAVRLGYVMYSNPDMTDYAWAVPCWVVDCEYVSGEYGKLKGEYGDNFGTESDCVWEKDCFLQMPINAQNGEAILFDVPTEDVLRVPDIVTWSNVK